MAEIYAVYDNGRGICSVSETDILNAVPVSDRRSFAAARKVVRYFRKQFKGDGIVYMDLGEFVSGDFYDAEKTEAVFRLAVVLRKKGCVSKLSPRTRRRIFRFIKAVTIAKWLKGRRLRRMRNFTGLCNACIDLAEKGKYSADEAVAIILSSLPSENDVIIETRFGSDILSVIEKAAALAAGCSDDSLRSRINEYLARFDKITAAEYKRGKQ